MAGCPSRPPPSHCARPPSAPRAYTHHIQPHTSGELMTDQYPSVWPDRPESTQHPGMTQHPGISSAAAERGYPPLPGYPVPANWGRRVQARLIDQAPTYLGLIIFLAGYLVWVVELARSGGSIPDSGGAVVAMIIGLSVMIGSLAGVV